MQLRVTRVFAVNDAKVLHHGRIHRLHEIAASGPFQYRLAIERKLALAFCEMAGIEAVPTPGEVPHNYLDCTPEELKELAREEAILSRGREWWSSSKAMFADVPAVNDFMRVHGIYESRKESL